MKKVLSKKNNGFTLIELLVTIVIMISLLIIVIVSFTSVSKRKKEEAYVLVKEQVETAAEQYISANEYLFEGLANGSKSQIPVEKLVSEDYLNRVTDPRTGKAITPCAYVEITKDGNSYNKVFNENENGNGETCPAGTDFKIIEAGGPKISADAIGTIGNNNWYKEENPTITVTVSTEGNGQITKIEMSTNDGIYEDVSEKFTSNEYNFPQSDTNGTTYKFRAFNANGKMASTEIKLKVDTLKPKCNSSIAVTNKDKIVKGWYNKQTGKPKLTFTVTDTGSGFKDGKTEKIYNIPIDEGDKSYSKKDVPDQAGNKVTCSINVKYDGTAPSVPKVQYLKWNENNPKIEPNLSNYKSLKTSYTLGEWSNKKVYTRAYGSKDSLSDVHYQYTTTGATTNEANAASNGDRNIEANGKSTIKYRACDDAGNCSIYTGNAKIWVDHEPPVGFDIDVTATNDKPYFCNVKRDTSYVAGKKNFYVGEKSDDGGLAYSKYEDSNELYHDRCRDTHSKIKETYIIWYMKNGSIPKAYKNVYTKDDWVPFDQYKAKAGKYERTFKDTKNGSVIKYALKCVDNAGNESIPFKIDITRVKSCPQ